MAIYRLDSYPEAPPSMHRKMSRYAFCLGTFLLAAAGCVPLMFSAHALADRVRLPAAWLGNAIAVLFGLLLVAVLICALTLLNRPTYLRNYGQQWCGLTSGGLVYSGPGQPERFTPADALLSFSVARGRTRIKAAEPFFGASLPSELAHRDALWNELRLMGVPELPAQSPWAKALLFIPGFSLLLLCWGASAISQDFVVELLLGAPYVLFMVRVHWVIAKRENVEHSPLKHWGFYVGAVSSALLVLPFLLPLHGHRHHP